MELLGAFITIKFDGSLFLKTKGRILFKKKYSVVGPNVNAYSDLMI